MRVKMSKGVLNLVWATKIIFQTFAETTDHFLSGAGLEGQIF